LHIGYIGIYFDVSECELFGNDEYYFLLVIAGVVVIICIIVALIAVGIPSVRRQIFPFTRRKKEERV